MKNILIVLLLSFTAFGSIEWTTIGKTNENKIVTEIKQTLEPGWYTYWKNPGDSGGRAKILFKNSTIKHSDLKFPKPTILTYDPLVTYGYKNSVTYQLTIESESKDIEASFSWLECNDVCIPKETIITLKKGNDKLPLINPPNKQPIKTNISKVGNKLIFKLSNPVESAIFFPYENGYINPIKQSVKGDILTIKIIEPLPEKITGELFINSSNEGIHINTIPVHQSNPVKELLIILLGALIGGVLLNIMPCVLPIIGIKALQLSKQSSGSKKSDALLYQLGVTTSILGLFLGLYLFQLFGKSVGWGFQLQSPIMIQFLIMLFIIFLLSSLDAIVIQAPKKIQNTSISSHFGSGVITTIVATPCTAPFLGSALTYALFQPFIFGLLIFITLSIGLGAPITLLMLNPKIKPLIPKSGNWNQTIKYGLGFGFVATIIWLTWILSNQVSTQYLMIFYM